MKRNFLFILIIFAIASCTLVEKPADYTHVLVDAKLHCLVETQDSAVSDYLIGLFTDTIDIYNQKPLHILLPETYASLPLDTFRTGYWIIIKKWIKTGPALLVSEPVFVKPYLPGNIKSFIIDIPNQIELKPKTIYSRIVKMDFLWEYYFNYNSVPWDSPGDDNVSGPKPDVYYTFDSTYASSVPFMIDKGTAESNGYTYGVTFYPPDPLIFKVNEKTQLRMMDYDFNTSPDDVMLEASLTIPAPHIESEQWTYSDVMSVYGQLAWAYLYLQYY